jgi:hypothetical protein
MIEASALRTIEGDRLVESCPGCGARNSHPTVGPIPIFPYICTTCWLKGWRNQGTFAFQPGEEIDKSIADLDRRIAELETTL